MFKNTGVPKYLGKVFFKDCRVLLGVLPLVISFYNVDFPCKFQLYLVELWMTCTGSKSNLGSVHNRQTCMSFWTLNPHRPEPYGFLCPHTIHGVLNRIGRHLYNPLGNLPRI